MNYLLFLLALAGVIAHFMAKFMDSLTTKQAFDWKQHSVFAVYSCLVITAFLFGWNYVSPMMGGMELNNFTAFLLGYFADSLVKNLTNFNPFKT
jgi:hypothetical protein